MYLEEVIEVINQFSEDGKLNDLKAVAKELASRSEERSQNAEFYSPFAMKAKRYNKKILGGKPDDITVALSQIVQIDEGYTGFTAVNKY